MMIMCEVSESPLRPVNANALVSEVVEAVRQMGFVPNEERILSKWHRRVEHCYPTPFVGRDEILKKGDPFLRSRGI